MKLQLITAWVAAGYIVPVVSAQSSLVSTPQRTKAASHVVTIAPSPGPTHSAFIGGSDDCSGAEAISGSGPFTFNNTSATTGAQGQSNAACDFFGTTGIANDVWFVWTAPSTGPITLILCGLTNIDSKVAIYAGGGCPSGGAIACNDDACNLQSQLSIYVTGGNQYMIQLGNYPGASAGSGTFQIWTGCCHPPFCVPWQLDGVSCPCTRDNIMNFGCNNSDDTGGAYLSVSGVPSLGSDTVAFTCIGEKASALSVVLQGDTISEGAVFGQGLLCTGGNLIRLYVEHAVEGSIAAPRAGEPSVSARSAALGDVLTVGATRHHQVYYRDPIVHPPCASTATFNVSQGQSITWYP